jgi:hypothetical protein
MSDDAPTTSPALTAGGRSNVLRVARRERNFLIVDHACVRDARLSLKAKGLHTYAMSVPDDWQFNLVAMQGVHDDGRDSILSAMNELVRYRYADLLTTRDGSGKISGTVWTFYETPALAPAKPLGTPRGPRKSPPHTENPYAAPHTEKPHTANTDAEPQTGSPDAGKPHPANPPLLITELTKDLYMGETEPQTSGHPARDPTVPDPPRPSMTPVEHPEALIKSTYAAFEAWSMTSRGRPLVDIHNDHRPIRLLLDVVAQLPPIARGKEIIPRQNLVPQAAEHAHQARKPFERPQYAVKIVQSLLEEWAIKGMPGTRDEKNGRRPAPIRPALTPGENVMVHT